MHNLRGVTLIELLVAIVILGLIVTSVYTAFNSSRDAWQVGEIMIQRYQNARGALDIMSREISQAFINEAETIYCVGIDGESSLPLPPPYVKTNAVADSDQFFFVAPIGAASAATDLYRVGYWLREVPDPTNPALTLVTLQRVYEGPSELFGDRDDDGNDDDDYDNMDDEFDEAYGFYSGTSSQPLTCDNIVTALDFYFCYGTGWTDSDQGAPYRNGDWDSREDYYPPPGGDGIDDGLPQAVRIVIVVQDDKALTERTFSTVIYLATAE